MPRSINFIEIQHKYNPPYNERAAFAQPLHTYYDQLNIYLKIKGGEELGRYLAKPSVSKGSIAWFTDGSAQSSVKPYNGLSKRDQEALRRQIEAHHAKIANIINEFDSSGEEDSVKKKAAALLAQIVPVPDPRHIYSVDGRAVYVYWSHQQEKPFEDIKLPEIKRLSREVQSEVSSRETTDSPLKISHTDRTDVQVRFVGAGVFFGIALLASLVALLFVLAVVYSVDHVIYASNVRSVYGATEGVEAWT